MAARQLSDEALVAFVDQLQRLLTNTHQPRRVVLGPDPIELHPTPDRLVIRRGRLRVSIGLVEPPPELTNGDYVEWSCLLGVTDVDLH